MTASESWYLICVCDFRHFRGHRTFWGGRSSINTKEVLVVVVVGLFFPFLTEISMNIRWKHSDSGTSWSSDWFEKLWHLTLNTERWNLELYRAHILKLKCEIADRGRAALRYAEWTPSFLFALVYGRSEAQRSHTHTFSESRSKSLVQTPILIF